MKIAFSAAVVQGGKSGVATYIFGLLDALLRRGPEAEIHVLGLTEERGLFARWEDLAHFHWQEIPSAYRRAVANVYWHQTQLRGWLRRAGMDLLHVPSYRRVLWRCPVPQVVTVHDLAPFRLAGKYDPARMFYGRHVVRHLVHGAQGLCAVSQSTANDMHQFWGVPLERIEVIWNGIDHQLYRPQSAPAVESFLASRSLSVPYFIYLARLEHPGKNHLRLIEAYELYRQRHPQSGCALVLAGADWHGAEVIHQRIAASPWREQIHRVGFVPQNEVPLWYAGARAMIYPSLFEGFGLPPAEAMATGCPVICSNRGSLPEVVGEAAWMIDPEDVAAMTAAMERLGDDPAERARWSQLGLERSKLFHWDRAAEKIWHLYRHCVQAPS